MIYQPDRVAEVLGAITRQALKDHRARWQRKGTPNAYTYLRCAGLVDARGHLVGRARDSVTRRAERNRKPTIAATAAVGA